MPHQRMLGTSTVQTVEHDQSVDLIGKQTRIVSPPFPSGGPAKQSHLSDSAASANPVHHGPDVPCRFVRAHQGGSTCRGLLHLLWACGSAVSAHIHHIDSQATGGQVCCQGFSGHVQIE